MAIWTDTATLVGKDTDPGDAFGIEVAIHGHRALVAAFNDNKFAGSAYVFERDGNGWQQVAKLSANDAMVADFFGYSVDISGDRVIVGANMKDHLGAGLAQGAVYIFERAAGAWQQVANLTVQGKKGVRLGSAVAIDGDRAVAGAPAIAYTVKQSGGHVTIYSEVGEGTTIKLYLPRYTGGGAAIQDRAPAEAVTPAKGEVILAVEDDPDLRALLVHLLGSLGYGVLPATTGKEALEILQESPQVDLLLTDVVLPGDMGGAVLAGRAQELRPGLPVLYMSGYTENAIMHHGRLDAGVRLLQKPFRKDDLARKVREALDRTGA